MSKSSSVRFAFSFLAAALVWVALVVADFGVLAQNTNSSTTTEEETGVQNVNANTDHHGQRRRRGRRRARRRAPRPAATAAEAGTESSGGAQGATGGETQADLSGTYTGRVNCLDLSGEGTLTVTGNQFTMEAGGTTKSGRISAVTTRGYTGVSLRFDDASGATPSPGTAPPTPTVVSARARHHGDRLSLSTVPNEPNACSFTPAGGGGPRHGRRRGRRGRD